MARLSIHHGTVIIVARGSNYVVASADSRTTDETNTANDTRKKLIKLDNHTLFANAGINRIEEFIVTEEVRKAYSESGSGLPIELNARVWADKMARKLQTLPNDTKWGILGQLSGHNTSTYMTGIFAGVMNGSSIASVATIRTRREGTRFFADTDIREMPIDQTRVFAMDATQRKVIDLLNDREWCLKVLSVANKTRLEGARRLAFLHRKAMHEVIKDGSDTTIGGKVKTAILEGDRPLRWFADG